MITIENYNTPTCVVICMHSENILCASTSKMESPLDSYKEFEFDLDN